MDAHTGAPPASLPITTVHPPALFMARAFKNASFLSLKNLLSSVSAICAVAFPFPLVSLPRGGWEEDFLKGFWTRLISGSKAPLILFKTLITASDFWKWSTNKVVVHISSLYLDTNLSSNVRRHVSHSSTHGTSPGTEFTKIWVTRILANLTFDATDRLCCKH